MKKTARSKNLPALAHFLKFLQIFGLQNNTITIHHETVRIKPLEVGFKRLIDIQIAHESHIMKSKTGENFFFYFLLIFLRIFGLINCGELKQEMVNQAAARRRRKLTTHP